MENQVTKAEINSLTDFQKSLHIPAHEEEPFMSKFYRIYLKTPWYCSTPLPLKKSEEGDDVIYKLNPTYHYLMYSYVKFNLPPIKVKPDYVSKLRICWCHNVGTNVIKKCSFNEDDIEYQSFDSVWIDDYFQFYMPQGSGKRRNHNIGIGNVPALQDWTDEHNTTLPYYPINVDQPWYYSMDTALAFPILYHNSQNRAEHRYHYRRKISDLLRMQIYDSKLERWVSVNPKKHMRKLDFGRNTTIQTPNLWGRYAYVTDQEIETHKCKYLPKDIFIKDIVECDLANPNTYGTTAVIPLRSNYPCLAMFWKAQNNDAVELNQYSNYTSNTDVMNEGWDPISMNSLKYSAGYKWHNMESDHFNVAESRKHFLSSPCETGYHAYSFAWNSSNYHGEVGIDLSKLDASLICKIDDNNIYNKGYQSDIDADVNVDQESMDYDLMTSHPSQEVKGPNFNMRVRLLVLKKLTITKESKNFVFSLN